MEIDPQIVKQTAPGLLGAIGAIFFLKGPWYMRVGLVIPGGAAAHYGGQDVAIQTGMSVGLAAFATGLLSMVIVGKLVDAWNDLTLSTIFTNWLRKMLGVQGGDQ